jgi:hypothetical protein
VHLQLLDDVPDVPLDRVRGDAQMVSHGCRVETLRHQSQDLELARSELCDELLMVRRFGAQPALACDRFREQGNGYQHLAERSPAYRLDDLVSRS